MKHTMSGRLVAAACALVLATGCKTTDLTDPGPGRRVEVTLAQQSYVAGQSVDIVIRNLSGLTLRYPYGFCTMDLEREENSGWVTVASPDGCTFVLGFLGPRRSVQETYPLPTSISSGTYRLSMPMPWLASSTTAEPRLTTEPFQVTSGA
jgi:hypothetical protein